MNDFEGLLNSDYGFKAQGKAAPMAARSSSTRSTTTTGSGYANFVNDDDPIFNPSRGGKSQGLGSMDGFDDVFGGPPKYSSASDNRSKGDEFDFDSMFGGGGQQGGDAKGGGSRPVFDKPVFDEEVEEDVFVSKGSGLNDFENVFASIGTSLNGSAASPFDDFLGGGGSNISKKNDGVYVKKDAGDFDDLIPGFGGSSPATDRLSADSASKKYSHVKDDPFSGIGSPLTQEGPDSQTFTDPLDEIGKVGKNGNSVDESPVGVFEDVHPFERQGIERPSTTGSSTSGRYEFRSEKSPEKFSADSSGSSRKKAAHYNVSDSYQSMFSMPSNASNSHSYINRSGSPPPYEEYIASDINSPSTATLHKTEASDDIWLTVSEIPLFTQPTSAPPPSRPPPPRPARGRKTEARVPTPRTSVNDFPSTYNSTQNNQSFKSGFADPRSSIDELEDFSKGKAYSHSRAHTDSFDKNSQAQSDAAASAAVMKEVMNRAEAKFRHAKELKERENAKAYRNRESNTPKEYVDSLDSEFKRREDEDFEKQRFEQERMKEIELEREREREREEEDREQKRLERERERAREEREKARQAVERATREARERAAADARLRAEKAAREKANSEAKERAERLAVQRAQAEARERAAAEAKERAEKAAAEAKEREARARSNVEAKERAAKAEIEARMKAERAAVDRAAKEARERAAAQARERAAAQARERTSTARASQTKPEDDLESFFGTGSRPSSAPRPSANNSTKQETEDARRTSSTSSNIRKTSSATSFVDDLSSIFGGSPQSGIFQEVEGETEERRRARLERDQRTNDRAAKALAEKNERDLQAQREQAERHRFSETLDAEIKRWAAGKEGNIRALLSTMQYILWPECGWQPVSLTDLITGASVKKAYRKATLCIHPDKVQQKGANLQQKYIAEKVFDLLKEAWNKFNSEELF